MTRLLTVPAGRVAKFVVLAVCVLAFFASGAANLPGKYTDAENNESTSFLPSDAESTEVLEISEQLQGGEQAPIVIVYRREGGLSDDDQARIQADREELNAAIEANKGDIYRAVSPFAEPRPSESGDAALLIGNVTGDGDGATILDPIDDIRERVSDPGGGLEVKVTGPAGFAADAIKVFENINGTLLGSALLLVVFLLILIYRSPIFFLIPLFAVVFAEVATRSIGYGLTELGVTVNGQSSSILSILVLGAGTDYALLLVSRYREELRKHEDKHEAMALALRTAGPAIVASGATVICALLCLSIAQVEGTAGLGPIGALGIAVAMITMLTLLPALLVICGRRAFWHPSMVRHEQRHPALRRRGRRRDPRRLAPRRRPRGPRPAADLDRHRHAAGRRRARAAHDRHRTDAGRRVSRRGRVARRPGDPEQVVPGRRERGDRGDRAAGRRRGSRHALRWSRPTASRRCSRPTSRAIPARC